MRKIFTLQFFFNFINPDHKVDHFSVNDDSTEKAKYSAPDHCVENIMNFARSYKVTDSKSTGKIEMILN